MRRLIGLAIQGAILFFVVGGLIYNVGGIRDRVANRMAHDVSKAVARTPTSGPANGKLGVISGRLEAVGGPSPGKARPLTGTVSIKSDRTWQVPVGADGDFRASVPPGRYQLTGQSPMYQRGGGLCRVAGTVVVTVGKTVVANVICEQR